MFPNRKSDGYHRFTDMLQHIVSFATAYEKLICGSAGQEGQSILTNAKTLS
jgi:hypothetical protein